MKKSQEIAKNIAEQDKARAAKVYTAQAGRLRRLQSRLMVSLNVLI